MAVLGLSSPYFCYELAVESVQNIIPPRDEVVQISKMSTERVRLSCGNSEDLLDGCEGGIDKILPAAVLEVYRDPDAPTGFITAVCKHWQTNGTGFRSLDMTGSFDYWYPVPFRVRTKCVKLDGNEAHKGSHAAANQMNPFYYIHLTEVGDYIRGSHIAIYIHHDQSSKTTSVVLKNMAESRRARREPYSTIIIVVFVFAYSTALCYHMARSKTQGYTYRILKEAGESYHVTLVSNDFWYRGTRNS